MKNSIPNEYKAFFAVMAIMVPGIWLLFGFNNIVGLVFAALLVASVAASNKQDWQGIGELLDDKIITVVVLISGSLIVAAQYVNSI